LPLAESVLPGRGRGVGLGDRGTDLLAQVQTNDVPLAHDPLDPLVIDLDPLALDAARLRCFRMSPGAVTEVGTSEAGPGRAVIRRSPVPAVVPTRIPVS